MPRRRARRWMFWIVTLVVQFAIWLLLTNSFTLPELLAGAVSAALAATGATLLRDLIRRDYRPRWGDLQAAISLPRDLVIDSLRVLRIAVCRLLGSKRRFGGMYAAPVRIFGPRNASRRALVLTVSSMTPNTVALGVLRKRRLVLYHQLDGGAGVPGIFRRFGAKP